MAQTFGRSRRDVPTPKASTAGIQTGKTNAAAGSDRSGNAPRGGSKRLLRR